MAKSPRMAKKALSKGFKCQKIKLPSVSKAKKKAWEVFSQYIRRKYADVNGNCQCVTCNIIKPYKELHAGHFIDGRNNTVLYDERLVHPQCFHCNSKLPGCLGGNKVAYTLFMAKKYCLSMDQIAELQSLYFTSKPMKAYEHMEVFTKYTKLLEAL